MEKIYIIMITYFVFILYFGGTYGRMVSDDRRQVEDEVFEYCVGEDFKAKCLKNEVISMTGAIYGRMIMGKCLKEEIAVFEQYSNNPQYFGCSVDVLDIFDQRCSGRNNCSVNIFTDIDQRVKKPCAIFLRNYVQASFDCIPVVEPDRKCTVSVTSSAQHLMTSHSSTQSCGSRNQPWKLEAPAGQQINVSLLDFGGAENQRDGECLQYGYIIDREAKKNVSLCNRDGKRLINLMTSKSHELQVVLDKPETAFVSNLILGVTAIGCTQLTPPENMWLSRQDQEAVVGCYSSRQTWHLNCVNNQWLGVIGNCTREFISQKQKEVIVSNHKPAINNEVLAALVIAFSGLILCVAIVVCGFVCLKRYNTMKNCDKRKYGDCTKDLLTVECRNPPRVNKQQQPT